jgi:hypothetical protein
MQHSVRQQAPCTQADSPHEEREVYVIGHRWGTAHAVPISSVLRRSGLRPLQTDIRVTVASSPLKVLTPAIMGN